MSGVTLTDEQLAAITTREVSVALSAGAGCGKTHVLTERFLSHLDHGADGEPPARLDQLIAITFTDAAAREMRSRIRARCYQRLNAAEPAAQEHWLRLLREIDTARISTIHAFCAALLRSHAAEAGLDPTFGVLEQGEADVLQSEVIDDVLRDRLAAEDDDALDLAAAYGLGRLKEQVALLSECRDAASIERWLAPTNDRFDECLAAMLAAWRSLHAGEAFRECLRQIAEDASVAQIEQLLQHVEPSREKPKFVAAKADLLELLPRLGRGEGSADELQRLRQQACVSGVCTAKDWPSAEQYEEYKAACTRLRAAIDKHQPPPWDDATASEVAALGLKLLRLSSDVAAEYTRRKDALGQLDFDDLLQRAHQLLNDPQHAALRAALSAELRLLLVDEFQDTDPLQVELVRTVCGDGLQDGRLFFVGDFKQSIYRFRGATPEEFRQLKRQIDRRGWLPMTRNFRSQPAILSFVNALFCDEFEDYQPLAAARPQATEPPAVEFLWRRTPDKNSFRRGAAEVARREEARAIAARLRSLVDPACAERPVVDATSKEARRLRPGDVAILFRALSDVRLYEEALREQGLDYYLVGGHAFYAQQEVYDVLNLLRAVASTADEVSLAGVLRSPFFALHDETLFWLVEAGGPQHGAGSLNAGLFADRWPAEMPPTERAKVAAAAETLAHLRAIKDRVPVSKLLGEALDRTGYDAALLTEFLGERKLANLHKLLDAARAADEGGLVGLAGFITQLAEFIARPPKEPLASTCPESADVVRLMTIHHAKGLEFPLVVVPDLDRSPNVQPPPAALDRALGPLVPQPADEDGQRAATGMSLFAAAHRRDELEERKRLLYVATTRAADYLILSSSLEDYDKPKSDWMALLAERFDLEDGRLLARLPKGVEPPRVRIAPQPEAAAPPTGKSRGPDLVKLLENARRQAARGEGAPPREVSAIAADWRAGRQFSVSRLAEAVSPTVWPAAVSADGKREMVPDTFSVGLGRLVHDVLARIDFADPSQVALWCEQLAPRHVLVDSDRACRLATEMVERLVTSPRGRRLAAAAELHCEIDFLLAWPPGQPGGADRRFYGYLDCLYRDADGRWHLADYKTNHVAAADVPRLAQHYQMQLYVYAIAAERVLGQPPDELVLCFLQPGVEHVLPWNDSVRRRAVEMVSAAMGDRPTTTKRQDDIARNIRGANS